MFRKSISIVFLLGLTLHFALRSGLAKEVYESVQQEEITECGSSYLLGVVLPVPAIADPAITVVALALDTGLPFLNSPVVASPAVKQIIALCGETAYLQPLADSTPGRPFQPPRVG